MPVPPAPISQQLTPPRVLSDRHHFSVASKSRPSLWATVIQGATTIGTKMAGGQTRRCFYDAGELGTVPLTRYSCRNIEDDLPKAFAFGNCHPRPPAFCGRHMACADYNSRDTYSLAGPYPSHTQTLPPF